MTSIPNSFEAIWRIPEGITYNAYVLTTDEGAILFDTWKHIYAKDFIENLRRIIDPKDINYLVIHHMKQDHSGAVPILLAENRNRAKVLGHKLVKTMLKAFYGIEPKFKAVKDGEELVIGNKKIIFIHTPWLHWPETIMSYVQYESTRILLSGDAFGGFSIPPIIADENDEVVLKYLNFVKKYIVTIVGFYSKFILKNIEKIKSQGINPRIIAPAHGLIFKNKPELIINYYIKLAKGVAEKGKIVVIYSSMYGSVERAINVIVEELEKKGFKPIIYSFTDVNRSDIGEIISDIIDSEIVVIGASAYEGEIFPYMAFLLDIIARKVKSKKKFFVISSYGWGKTVSLKISEKLVQAGHEVVEKIEFHGQPTNRDLEKIKQSINLNIR